MTFTTSGIVPSLSHKEIIRIASRHHMNHWLLIDTCNQESPVRLAWTESVVCHWTVTYETRLSDASSVHGEPKSPTADVLRLFLSFTQQTVRVEIVAALRKPNYGHFSTSRVSRRVVLRWLLLTSACDRKASAAERSDLASAARVVQGALHGPVALVAHLEGLLRLSGAPSWLQTNGSASRLITADVIKHLRWTLSQPGNTHEFIRRRPGNTSTDTPNAAATDHRLLLAYGLIGV